MFLFRREYYRKYSGLDRQIRLNSLWALNFYISMAFPRTYFRASSLSSMSLSNIPLKELVCEGALQVYSVVSSNIL